jgi:hypothetical protein
MLLLLNSGCGMGYQVDGSFGSLDHEVIMNAVALRVRDKRLLNLLRMWLTAGQVCREAEQPGAGEAPLLERLGDYATGSVNEAVSYLLDERGYGAGYGAYTPYPSSPDEDESLDSAAEARKAARREAYKRLGRDLALLGVTFIGRRGRLFSPVSWRWLGREW